MSGSEQYEARLDGISDYSEEPNISNHRTSKSSSSSSFRQANGSPNNKKFRKNDNVNQDELQDVSSHLVVKPLNKVASVEMCYFCFDVLYAHLFPKQSSGVGRPSFGNQS